MNTLKKFIQRHASLLLKVLYAIIAGLVTWGLLFALVPLGYIITPLACSSASGLCSNNSGDTLVFLILCASLISIAAGTLTLRTYLKMSWPKSILCILIDFSAIYFAYGLASSIMQSDTPNYVGFIISFLSASITTTAVLLLSGRRRKINYIALGIFCLAMGAIIIIIGQHSDKLHEDFDKYMVSVTANDLPFKVYAPTHIPQNYSLVDATVTETNKAESYDLKYSTGTEATPYPIGASTFSIHEIALEGLDVNSLHCSKDGDVAKGGCRNLGNTDMCRLVAEGATGLYVCFTDTTRVILAMTKGQFSDQQVMKIFSSLKQGAARS